jgi:hypothetical protein
MDSANDSVCEARLKRTGTREEVFKGLAARTAGGLKKDDIIAKQFGSRTLYISKRLSDRMRENFQHANSFRKRVRKTLVATSNPNSDVNAISRNDAKKTCVVNVKAPHGKTQKLSFKVHDNPVKNVYYKELNGMNIQKLKEELKQEEAEEDLGISTAREGGGEFKIEDVPDISLDELE